VGESALRRVDVSFLHLCKIIHKVLAYALNEYIIQLSDAAIQRQRKQGNYHDYISTWVLSSRLPSMELLLLARLSKIQRLKLARLDSLLTILTGSIKAKQSQLFLMNPASQFLKNLTKNTA
jgi:hypothetical protein